MFKGVARLECVVDGRSGHFYVDNDCPITHVKEMLFQFQKYIGAIEDQAKAQAEAIKVTEESIKKEEPESEKIVSIEQQEEQKE